MHFSKTYAQLLYSLPPEFRDSAIEYRQLKKLINQVVKELNGLGLSPEVLQHALQSSALGKEAQGENNENFKVVYELVNVADHVEPRLRLWVKPKDSEDDFSDMIPTITLPLSSVDGQARITSESQEDLAEQERPNSPLAASIISSLAESSFSHDERSVAGPSTSPPDSDVTSREMIIPLASDMTFFDVLIRALDSLTTRLAVMRVDFEADLERLARGVTLTARPLSTSSAFHPTSPLSTNPGTVSVHNPFSHALAVGSKSDLYVWREIFQLYVESEIHESTAELTRGERALPDSEARFALFSERIAERVRAGHAFKLKESRAAFATFMRLNAFVLDLRKFQHATSEATRKILKKHAKRTALPLAPALPSPFALPAGSPSAAVAGAIVPWSARIPGGSLSLMLGQALGQAVLPIIPHIDDYACLICTSIAFKPIRLRCGHLFCVRCLVKMQKRGQDHCPMCRASTVLSADRSNVDWALLNFMRDWFPRECKEKLKQNEKEATREELEELGLQVQGCVIM
ncbi:hypothetical protein CERSUDRAFT_118760 [Gelatoporia subvermispora B]|uniref:RING-type domain-containing protein n=1 Tax=Ceriporiopsis subvermispora (strain B) TaxID=914234 RepID=M2PAB9_CERS8|nr:hypothetical protein CERSUDRAFT_118760 [Gelatoporia subvermispora B]